MAFKAWLRKEIQNKAQNFSAKWSRNEEKVPAVGDVLCGDTFYTLYLATSGKPVPPATQTTPDLCNANTYIFSAARVAFSIIRPQEKSKPRNKNTSSLQVPHAPPSLPPAKQRKNSERRRPLDSDVVFFFLVRVVVTPFGVDDGRVGVGRVVRPLGFVREVGACVGFREMLIDKSNISITSGCLIDAIVGF